MRSHRFPSQPRRRTKSKYPEKAPQARFLTHNPYSRLLWWTPSESVGRLGGRRRRRIMIMLDSARKRYRSDPANVAKRTRIRSRVFAWKVPIPVSTPRTHAHAAPSMVSHVGWSRTVHDALTAPSRPKRRRPSSSSRSACPGRERRGPADDLVRRATWISLVGDLPCSS